MGLSRRAFLKTTAMGGAALPLLGFNTEQAYAQASELKIARTHRDALNLSILRGELRRHHSHHR